MVFVTFVSVRHFSLPNRMIQSGDSTICAPLKELESGCKGPRSAEDLSVLCYLNDNYGLCGVQIDVHYSLPRDDNLSKGGDKNQVSLFQPR